MLDNNFSLHILQSIDYVHNQGLIHFTNSLKSHSEKKFHFLQCKNSIPDIDNPFNAQSNWFLNLSSFDIPDDVTHVMSLGRNFKFCDVNNYNNISLNNDIDYIKSVENLITTYDLNEEISNDIRNSLINNLRYHNNNSPRHINIYDRIFSKNLSNAKSFVKSHDNIIFTVADKGNVTVALDRTEYLQKIESMLSDNNTYKKIIRDPLPKLKNRAYTILKHLNNNNLFYKKFNDNELTQTNTNLSKIYGLPKIHKNNIPLRPVVSTIGSPTHFLSKQLFNILNNAIKKPKSYLRNSYDFINRIKPFLIPDDHILISLDATSLFTNVNSEHVRDSLIKRYCTISQCSNISLDDLLESCQFLFDSIYFKFNNNYYQQIYGTPMGSSISGLFADIVMDDLETSCISKLSFKPLFYYRYVDDIITCIPKNKIDEIIGVFNGYDNRLQFTSEIQNNNSISFLDVLLINENNCLITDWYKKPTFSGSTINYYSKHPLAQKIAIVYNFVHRAIKLSHKKFHTKNIKFVTETM